MVAHAGEYILVFIWLDVDSATRGRARAKDKKQQEKLPGEKPDSAQVQSTPSALRFANLDINRTPTHGSGKSSRGLFGTEADHPSRHRWLVLQYGRRKPCDTFYARHKIVVCTDIEASEHDPRASTGVCLVLFFPLRHTRGAHPRPRSVSV